MAIKFESRLAQSHRRQFDGEDYEVVAKELADTEEQFEKFSTEPTPGCDCGFCETADWWD